SPTMPAVPLRQPTARSASRPLSYLHCTSSCVPLALVGDGDGDRVAVSAGCRGRLAWHSTVDRQRLAATTARATNRVGTDRVAPDCRAAVVLIQGVVHGSAARRHLAQSDRRAGSDASVQANRVGGGVGA